VKEKFVEKEWLVGSNCQDESSDRTGISGEEIDVS